MLHEQKVSLSMLALTLSHNSCTMIGSVKINCQPPKRKSEISFDKNKNFIFGISKPFKIIPDNSLSSGSIQ